MSSEHRRLDELEVFLTPREWIIRLVQEMREHPSLRHFYKAVSKREYRDWPWVKPFYKLSEQAKERHPGCRSEDLHQRAGLSRELGTEFQTLRILIGRAEEIIRTTIDEIALRTEQKIFQLEALIETKRFGRVAKSAAEFIEPTVQGNKEKQAILDELRIFAAHDSLDDLLIENLAKDLTVNLKDALTLQSDLEVTQHRYFDGHPILPRDVEYKLKQTIEATIDAAERFEAFLGERTDTNAILDRPMIDMEQMMKDASRDASVDMLQESGEDGIHRLQIFRELANLIE
jgi:hypothetical protein